jgi:hypothetical protein
MLGRNGSTSTNGTLNMSLDSADAAPPRPSLLRIANLSRRHARNARLGFAISIHPNGCGSTHDHQGGQNNDDRNYCSAQNKNLQGIAENLRRIISWVSL